VRRTPFLRCASILVGVVLASLGGAASDANAHVTARSPFVVGLPSGCAPGAQPIPLVVLVAREFIRKGTVGLMILRNQMYAVASISCSQRLEGALDDARLLRGRIAIRDIFPGQQLVRLDFSGVLKSSLTSPVRAGSYARLTVRVTPPSRCTIRLTYNGGSEERGLGPRRGGRITWWWKVRRDARPGRCPIIVRCGASGSLNLKMRVLAR